MRCESNTQESRLQSDAVLLCFNSLNVFNKIYVFSKKLQQYFKRLEVILQKVYSICKIARSEIRSHLSLGCHSVNRKMKVRENKRKILNCYTSEMIH